MKMPVDFKRTVAFRVPQGMGYLVTYSGCAHQVWWAILPPQDEFVCALCLTEFMKRRRRMLAKGPVVESAKAAGR